MNEWKPIKGYEGLYEVAFTGQIRNCKTLKILKPVLNEYTGYYQTSLSKDKKAKGVLIHRVVAEAFIPNPYNFPTVNHKDEDKSNNCAANLEWCTLEYNTKYSNCKPIKGINKDGDILVYPSAKAAKGFNPQCIYACCKGRLDLHKGYKWRYITKEEFRNLNEGATALEIARKDMQDSHSDLTVSPEEYKRLIKLVDEYYNQSPLV